MKSFVLLAIMLVFLSCDEISPTQSTTTTPTDTVYVVVQSSSSGLDISSSSYVQPVYYTIPLNTVGVPRTYTVDGRVGEISKQSTSKLTVINDTTYRIDFTANDIDPKSDVPEWIGGHTMVYLVFDIIKPLDFEHMKNILIGQVELGDLGENIDPGYFGFIYGDDVRVIDFVWRDQFKDSNKDGLIHNLTWDVSRTNLIAQKCIDGLCSPAICNETSCDATRIGFYFWASQGTSYLTVTGMSVRMFE